MAKARKIPSGSWRCQSYDYTDANGKRHYKSFTASTKKEAEYMAAEYQVNKKKPSGEDITFGDALEHYITQRTPVLSPASIREYKRAIKNYDDIHKIKIRDITQDIIQEHVNIFSTDHSPKSVRDNHALITAVLRIYRPDFALNTVLPQKRRPELYIPTDADLKKVIAAAEGTEMEIPILLAAFGPMRRGEICALRYEDISGNQVHVCRNMVMDENKKYVIKAPKSYAGDRFINFPAFVAKKLNGTEGNITNLNPNMVTQRFNHVLIKAGVPHFRFHDLRHYCASILHALGMADAYIMERGGWGNDGTLKNVYRHTLEDKKAEMSQKVNNYFEAMTENIQIRKAILKEYNNKILQPVNTYDDIKIKNDEATEILYNYKNKLEQRGWILNLHEGSMMSPDLSTLFVLSRPPYDGQLLLFDNEKRKEYNRILDELIACGDFNLIK